MDKKSEKKMLKGKHNLEMNMRNMSYEIILMLIEKNGGLYAFGDNYFILNMDSH